MKRFYFLITLILGSSVCCHKTIVETRTQSKTNDKLIFLNDGQLEQVKGLIARHDAYFMDAYNQLITEANDELSKPANPVTNKTQVPPSGDKHDYLSLAPYWWPDPNTDDGFPWIVKDGEVDPLTRGNNTDQVRLSEMFEGLNRLSMAYYFSGDTKYAQKARSVINTWFIDADTKVNPNVNFGQGIPGDKDQQGRPAGLIEWNGISNLITTIQLLQRDGLQSDGEINALNSWLSKFYNWMKTSKYGVADDNGKQNHANWYDYKMVGLARYLGLESEAKSRVEAAKTKRIAKQIEPDGSQPQELRRTKSVYYSEMNLRAMSLVAEMGMPLGVDLWKYSTADGRSLRKAYEYLRPYAQGDKKWTYKQITPGGADKAIEDRLKPLFSIGSTIFGEELIDQRAKPAENLSYMQKLQYPPLSKIK